MTQANAAQTSQHDADDAVRRCLAVEFSIDGDLRYLSHHNTVTMLTRGLVRAGIPVRHSQGFNPMPRIALPLPRPVGVASDAELAWIELSAPVDAADAAARLSAALPNDCRICRVTTTHQTRVPLARSASYETTIEADATNAASVRLRRLMSLNELRIARDSGPSKPRREIDIRPFVAALSMDEDTLRMQLRITEKGSAKPAEILSELGLAADIYVSRTRRIRVEWNVDFAAGATAAAARAGKDLI